MPDFGPRVVGILRDQIITLTNLVAEATVMEADRNQLRESVADYSDILRRVREASGADLGIDMIPHLQDLKKDADAWRQQQGRAKLAFVSNEMNVAAINDRWLPHPQDWRYRDVVWLLRRIEELEPQLIDKEPAHAGT